MAVFMLNVCKFNSCGLTFKSLTHLIQHIEETHIDYDPHVVERTEQQQPPCIPLSYVLRFLTDAARRENAKSLQHQTISAATTITAAAATQATTISTVLPHQVAAAAAAGATPTAAVAGSGGITLNRPLNNHHHHYQQQQQQQTCHAAVTTNATTTPAAATTMINHHHQQQQQRAGNLKSLTPTTGSEAGEDDDDDDDDEDDDDDDDDDEDDDDVNSRTNNNNEDDDDILSEATSTAGTANDDNSNDSWTTLEEFSQDYILRYGSRISYHSGSSEGNKNDKPFACPVPGCKKRYKNVNGIKYHSKNGHKNDGKVRKAFKCPCGKSYKTQYGLKNHTMVRHNNGLNTSIQVKLPSQPSHHSKHHHQQQQQKSVESSNHHHYKDDYKSSNNSNNNHHHHVSYPKMSKIKVPAIQDHGYMKQDRSIYCNDSEMSEDYETNGLGILTPAASPANSSSGASGGGYTTKLNEQSYHNHKYSSHQAQQ